MHKSEAEKIDSILDEHQQIYRRHNRIDNILAYCACIAWIPCIIAAFGVDGIYGGLRRNRRNFRYPSFKPATNVSRSISSLLFWKV